MRGRKGESELFGSGDSVVFFVSYANIVGLCWYEIQVRVDCYVPECGRVFEGGKVVNLDLQVPHRGLLGVAVVGGQGYCEPKPYFLDLCDLFNDCYRTKNPTN